MAEVKVLIKGYAKEIENGWIASSTTTLVKTNGKNIIVDPGCNREKLITALNKNDLAVEDIDYVLSTHNHADHILLNGIFENAKVVTNAEIYDNDYQVDYEGKIPELDIEILKTPGHSIDSQSYLIKTDSATYIIAGDVFWWMDSEEQKTDYDSLMSHEDPYVKDKSILENSRKKVLELADYIIPGHGETFKVNSEE